jgi:hypothetical protein
MTFREAGAGLAWGVKRGLARCQSRTVWTRPHPVISTTEASMRNHSTVYVGLDVHKESITVAYAVDAGEVESLGKIGI